MTSNFAYQYMTSGRPVVEHGRELIDRTLLARADEALQGQAEVTGDRPVWAQDLLHMARAVHLADKLSLRAAADDRWSRQIDLSVQVRAVDRWAGRPLELLSRLAEALTADRWMISARPGAAAWPHQQRTHPGPPVEEVALFSGGLDSFAYAAERSRASDGNILFVSYYEPQWKAQQDRAIAMIRDAAGSNAMPVRASQQVFAGRRKLEPSARTRGLLYAATAVYLAAAHDVSHVAVPENGQLALNPALTPARVAACSTRSVHPYTLSLLNELIHTLGGSMTVVNPYLHLTKGEVCERALRAGLAPATLSSTTLSCGRPPRNRPELHCGCCYPCLIRRSGLLAASGVDSTPYAKDVWALPDHQKAATDRRALHRWLNREFTLRDLVTDMPLPDGLDLAPLLDVVQRGRVELTDMFVRHARSAGQLNP
ncbi:7-cyano-7-deazaguanine synthase [Micromonospora peucetia]|uniref:7-cyano-7-deazaguanine synthase (Queuosine biosynthesis) n=1 Tax=Micromonospora peucetia TaxID=47871 RepID=A0A1C6VLU3_9ACTN|nr:7-cyano-7-deazaguanine synthase [Micromonospora peucetia]SCL67207.1 7-cyano-7-deazaguanine synthase (queuosine biosynthesis) [Micromonospora peucetia]